MGLFGWSVILASVVYVVIRPPQWFPTWRRFADMFALIASSEATTKRTPRDASTRENGTRGDNNAMTSTTSVEIGTRRQAPTPRLAVMPPPPTIAEPDGRQGTAAGGEAEDESSPTTPKATTAPPSLMAPPPRPSPNRYPTSPAPQFPAANSAQRARGPAPDRNPFSSSSSSSAIPSLSGGLVPPPTHSSKPEKPSRQVILSPGHSPLDWARISGPNSDLRGLPPQTPYLRVTPSMLKRQTGRKGKDAWMALNGRVYNVSPYADFHPGGVPELMRGAGRDGTKLFGEIHPWVNYETMLASCLVGLLVDEPEAGRESEMEKMD